MTEDRYQQVTYGITLVVATMLAQQNPGMTFVYVSGMGTDSSEHGRTMWARVKGKTENALLKLHFQAVYLFRPAAIIARHGIRSKTKWYRALYAVTGPFLPWLYAHFPKYVTTTEQVGRAMIKVVQHGAPRPVLENAEINRL